MNSKANKKSALLICDKKYVPTLLCRNMCSHCNLFKQLIQVITQPKTNYYKPAAF